jgi:putative peptidoglycan lipid II flippase
VPGDQQTAAPRGVLRSSGIVALGTLFSRGTGFIRLIATTYAIGATALADTYTLANTTPNIVYDLLLGGVFAATLVPVFVAHTEEGDDEGTSAVISVMLVALVGITIVGILAAPLLVRLYTLTAESSVKAEQRQVATNLLRLFMPQMVFYGLTALWTALLNARRVFGWPSFAPALNNLLVSAVLIALPSVAGGHPDLGHVQNDRGLMLFLGVGTTAGIVLMAVALYPSVRRSGFRFRFLPSLRNPAVREVGRMSSWTLGYVVCNQVALFLVLLLANRQVSGVSSYTYAYIFFILPYALVGVSLMTTIVPELSSAAGRGDDAAYRHHFSYGVRLMSVAVLPAAVGYILLAKPLFRVIKLGAFGADQADLTARNLACFSVGLLGYAIYLYTLRGFYALRDTRTPFWVNLFENVLNVVLALILEPIWGVPGLALSFGLAYLFAALVAMAALRRRVHGLDVAEILASLVRVGAASAVMAAAVAVAVRVVGDVAIVQLAVGLAVGGGVYAVAVLALRVPEVATIRTRLMRRQA